MEPIGSALDNAMAESFFSRLQLDLLDTRIWGTRAELAAAIFEWIEGWYNPHRRHSSIGYLSPVDYERHFGSRRGEGVVAMAGRALRIGMPEERVASVCLAWTEALLAAI